MKFSYKFELIKTNEFYILHIINIVGMMTTMIMI